MKVSELPEEQKYQGRAGKGKKAKPIPKRDDDSDEEGKSAGFNESTSVYQIRKILTSDQYTLGRNVS